MFSFDVCVKLVLVFLGHKLADLVLLALPYM